MAPLWQPGIVWARDRVYNDLGEGIHTKTPGYVSGVISGIKFEYSLHADKQIIKFAFI